MKLPMPPPKLKDIYGKYSEEKDFFEKIIVLMQTEIGKDREESYLHWDNLRFKKPIPNPIKSHEIWWLIVKMRRQSTYRNLPFKSKDNEHFKYWLPDRLQEMLHKIDKRGTGEIQDQEGVVNKSNKKRFLINSLMDEAITSSQLEGAATTYKVAKDMLREERDPMDKSEQMIFNNYNAMKFIREVKNEMLTPEIIFELHKIVTEGTLENEEASGAFRREGDDIGVYSEDDNTLLHSPPPAKELKERVDKICDFANEENRAGEFFHPVVKAIILHFMIGYDHPFVDGNGRTARALFYWSMAKQDYWKMEYISISRVFKNSPGKYAKAYLYTETDDYDLTYFIDFNLKTILKSIREFDEYCKRKAEETRNVEVNINNLKLSQNLNHRQIALLSHAIRNEGHIYTINSHQNSHQVSYPTARKDLYNLVDIHLFKKIKRGYEFIFFAESDLEERLRKM